MTETVLRTADVPEPDGTGIHSCKLTSVFKLAVIGSGPAAHTAAVYLARAELKRKFFSSFFSLFDCDAHRSRREISSMY